MPDWSYRTVLRPAMLVMGAERSRRLSVATLAAMARLPFGPALIDFLGHMRPDPRLRSRLGPLELSGPVVLGSLVDPTGKAATAFARFGAGLLEIGPVGEEPSHTSPAWAVDFRSRTISAPEETVAGLDEVMANLHQVPADIPVCIRIDSRARSPRNIAARLAPRAAFFAVEAEMVPAVHDLRPTLARIRAGDGRAAGIAAEAIAAGATGVWIRGQIDAAVLCVVELRGRLGREALIVAGGVVDPEDARRLLDAGADAAAVDAGLVCSGPGLVKRCNEALASRLAPAAGPEPLSLDAARRAWFWALLLGVAMFGGGLLAITIASTRVVLPYDEAMSGMTRAEIRKLNPRLLSFMAHDRVSLAGSMLSLGILYAALGWFGVRRGAHWAQVAVIASAGAGFLTFFLFLGFGYFDPFHAFVTAILTQFTIMCTTMQPSPPQPLRAEWRESAAWRRGQWGQLLFVLIGATLVGAGAVISFLGSTIVFVATDLEFMRTTAAALRASYEHLVPLVAHDRASLGGMLIANGLVIWLSAQWGFHGGERWLWFALAWAGNLAFASAVIVHLVVGYSSPLHLAPAVLGWAAWNGGLLLTHAWLTAPSSS